MTTTDHRTDVELALPAYVDDMPPAEELGPFFGTGPGKKRDRKSTRKDVKPTTSDTDKPTYYVVDNPHLKRTTTSGGISIAGCVGLAAAVAAGADRIEIGGVALAALVAAHGYHLVRWYLFDANPPQSAFRKLR
jgi:hypothetical protein